MWLTALSGLFTSWIDAKKEKQKAEAALHMQLAQTEASWDNIAQRQSQYSWKDEFITLVWYSPLVVAWFEPELAMQWIDFVQGLPYFYQMGMFGIMAATFGLRWFFKQQNFKISKKEGENK